MGSGDDIEMKKYLKQKSTTDIGVSINPDYKNNESNNMI